jgi:hypothetical protein
MAISERAKATKVKIRNNNFKTFGIYGVVVLMFLIGFIGVISYVNTYKKEVEVLSFNKSMIDRELIEESFMTKLVLAEKDLKDGMVDWKEREQYVGKYVAHFVRAETPLYSDMFTEEQALRTAYLYSLETDEELLTFPYDISTAGGKLVTPGDRLRIRGSYESEDGSTDVSNVEVDDDGKTIDSGAEKMNGVVADIIFDVVDVKDLLNSANESIVDIISDANKLPQKDREVLMTSEDFITSITPKAILMVVKTKDIDKYVAFQAKESPTYTITLLTRNEELKSTELNTGNSLLQLLQESQNAAAGTSTSAE